MRVNKTHVALIVACALLPFMSHGSDASCCSLATSFAADLFPGGQGDEDFFTVPGGPPSVMIVLDTSGSMLDFPQALAWPAELQADQGTCSVLEYEDAAAARLIAGTATFERAISFTGGNASNPTWVTTGEDKNGCLANSAGNDDCLFNYSKFYRYRPDDQSPAIIPVNTKGTVNNRDVTETDWNERSAWARTDPASACYQLSSGDPTTNCTSCLASKGYYLYKDRLGNRRAAFSGAFLNVYPPKFITARRVLKELLAINPANPSNSDNVRFGLTTFQPGGSSATPHDALADADGGVLKKPILPTCTDAIADEPTRTANFVAARAGLLTALDALVFDGTTPLAETLFNVGQYFSDGSSSDGTGSQWVGWFNSGFWRSSFWNGAGSSQSVCWGCQQSSVLLITDGEPKNDNNLPLSGVSAHEQFLVGGKGDFVNWRGGTLDPSKKLPIDCTDPDTGAWLCGQDLSGNGQNNLLHLVAGVLRYNDLRPAMDKDQVVSTYTVSFGIPSTSPGAQLLQKTADLGGGLFAQASNADDLANAVFSAVSDTITKATSFSVSNTNTLQAATAAQLFTARFRPLDRLSWEGHVYRFTLFNESALGCDPAKTTAAQTLVACGNNPSVNPNIDGSVGADGKATCDGFYIVDQDCDPVIEDQDTGAFRKASFSNGALSPTASAAAPFWDAGRALSDSSAANTAYRSAEDSATNDPSESRSHRRILTVLDSGGDGRYTSSDAPASSDLVSFDIANVAQLRPYLGADDAWCKALYRRLGFKLSGNANTALSDDERTTCAKQIIYFIRGWDVLDEDEDGCAGPSGLGKVSDNLRQQRPKMCTEDSQCSPGGAGSCVSGRCTCAAGTLGEQRDLANGHWKLGDIFHSSPQVVDPPYDASMCDIARAQTQCVPTIHSPAALTRETQTKIVVNSSTKKDAYDDWREDSKARKRIVLAGANDGMLHAFDAGDADTSKPLDAFNGYSYTYGTGAELWAFIPPDLLPKLKDALVAHQYFVDGNVMVRDVWVDGGPSGTGTKDRIKQKDEFHTLAIVSERSGGMHWTALDVTDPANPKFRWIFPQVCTLESLLVGQSWSDFSPRPPPIGPVKIQLPTGETDPVGRSFEERWIVMVNGGYDPAVSRGRGVWMLDAFTGETVWSFTDEDFRKLEPGAEIGSMFPVPGSPALVDIGNASQAVLDSDGYFDTATWGDMGGQLWVARFAQPGRLGSDGRVTNWFGARAMEELRQSDDSQPFSQMLDGGSTRQHRSEFYRMTANIWEPDTATLRSFLGSGNRERLLTVGHDCGPSNVIGCAQAGCNDLDLDYTTKVGACEVTTRFMHKDGKLVHSSNETKGTCTGTLSCGTQGVSVDLRLHIQKCNNANYQGNPWTAELSCDASGNCSTRDKEFKQHKANTKNWTALSSHNRFYGVWVYSSDRRFKDTSGSESSAAGARAYDRGRFTDVPFAASCPGPVGTKCTLVNVTKAQVDGAGAVTCSGGGSDCWGTVNDAGWYYEYGRQDPTLPTWTGVNWTDEKTGSGANVVSRCVTWNTIRPMGSGVGTTPCSSGGGAPRNYTYFVDAISGTPSKQSGVECGFQASSGANMSRALARTSIAPPLDPTVVVTVSELGSVSQSALQIEPYSTQSKRVSSRSDLSQPIYWLEVPRDLHSCRHVDAAVCE